MKGRVTREQARDMAEAHAEGLHADLPREFCPECEGRELRDYPLAAKYEIGTSPPRLFDTLAEALRAAEKVYAETGSIVSVHEAERGK